MKNNLRSGVSLVESSIVFLIVAMVAVGILGGTELVRTVKRHKIVDAVLNMQSAINTFTMKYHCLPGDCSDAFSFFGSAVRITANGGHGAGYLKGNNDGIYGYATVASSLSYTEELIAYTHMTLAKIGGYNAISFSNSHIPCWEGPGVYENQWTDRCGFPLYPLNTRLFPTTTWIEGFGADDMLGICINGNVGCRSEIGRDTSDREYVGQDSIPDDVRALDTKMDDGRPLAGSFLSPCVNNPATGNPYPYNPDPNYNVAERFDNFDSSDFTSAGIKIENVLYSESYVHCHGFYKF